MPAPSYEDVWKYADALQKVSQQAKNDFLEAVKDVDFTDPTAAREQLQEIVQGIVDWYGLAAQDLGAQWFEYCEELATQANPSQLVGDTGRYSTRSDVDKLVDQAIDGTIDQQKLVELLQGVVVEQTKRRARSEIESRIAEKMQQDGISGGRGGVKYGYARVPVGDTCAYCIMLASRGFDYWSEKTAKSASHDGCNCVIVPFHKADSIPGYEDKLASYKEQYADARKAVRDPSPELKDRIDLARHNHEVAYQEGKTTKRWSQMNEITIAMRYQGNELGFRRETEATESAAEAAAAKAVDTKPTRTRTAPQTERERLEEQAREAYVRNGGGQGLTEEQANERFDLLVDGNTDAQLRQYIRKHGK